MRVFDGKDLRPRYPSFALECVISVCSCGKPRTVIGGEPKIEFCPLPTPPF